MPRYRYHARDALGTSQSGELEAAGVLELASLLAGRGLELRGARALRTCAFLRDKRLTRQEGIHFFTQLAQLLAAGLPMLEILQDLQKAPGRMGGLAAGLAEGIANGSGLAMALRHQPGAFDAVLVNLIEAGEQSGRLGEVLQHVIEDLRWQHEQAALTHRLLLYPAIVAVSLLASLGFLLAYVVPQLASFLVGMGQALPVQTRVLLACAATLKANGLSLLLVVAGLAAATLLAYRGSEALAMRMDALVLRLPLAGPILTRLAMTRVCAVFGLLYGAGIAIPEALRTASSVTGNRALRHALRAATRAIDEGAGLAAGFAGTGFFPPLMQRMLRVGEQSGSLELALRHVATSFGFEARESVAQLQALLVPITVGTLGSLMLWIVWAVFTPLYALLTELKV